ncbi:putative C9orf72-like protein family [Paratrimastix pyriformis]|uniref:C9orf72-like protein family n=1 Tax=Paratrimastix pyriformis TaxID=342808 RepID=A0ABQ8UKA9_9EUKA|nr:putative C9orf72-like protein family [Paratrimastix pyriformis]
MRWSRISHLALRSIEDFVLWCIRPRGNWALGTRLFSFPSDLPNHFSRFLAIASCPRANTFPPIRAKCLAMPAVSEKMQKGPDPFQYSDFIITFQLSLWDNTYGPKVLQTWGDSSFPAELRDHFGRAVLDGEVCRNIPADVIESKFNMNSDPAYIVPSVLFTAQHKRDLTRYALSLVISRTHLTRVLEIHTLIADILKSLALRLRALLNSKHPNALLVFGRCLPSKAEELEAIFQATVSPPLFNNTFLFTPPNVPPNNVDFFAKVLTSHFQTGGCTLVMGNTPDEINQMIDSLLLFSPPETLRCARRMYNFTSSQIQHINQARLQQRQGKPAAGTTHPPTPASGAPPASSASTTSAPFTNPSAPSTPSSSVSLTGAPIPRTVAPQASAVPPIPPPPLMTVPGGDLPPDAGTSGEAGAQPPPPSPADPAAPSGQAADDATDSRQRSDSVAGQTLLPSLPGQSTGAPADEKEALSTQATPSLVETKNVISTTELLWRLKLQGPPIVLCMPFLTPCAYAARYIPGLRIQGLLKPLVDETTNSETMLLEGPTPSTLVDVSRRTVRQNPSFGDFAAWRKEFQENQRREDLAICFGKKLPPPYAKVDFLLDMGTPAPIVMELLREVTAVSPMGVRHAYCQQWFRILTRHSLVLALTVDKLCKENPNPDAMMARRLEQLLHIENSDLRALLALSERLVPGIAQSVLTQDPRATAVVEFLEF